MSNSVRPHRRQPTRLPRQWDSPGKNTSEFFWQNSVSLCPASFVLQGQTCLSLQVYPDFLLLHSNSWWWIEHLFLGVSSRRSSRSSYNWSTTASLALVVGAYTWITVMVNGLSWKWTEIILPLLRLHPSTVFQTLFLIMRATLFLIWKDYYSTNKWDKF